MLCLLAFFRRVWAIQNTFSAIEDLDCWCYGTHIKLLIHFTLLYSAGMYFSTRIKAFFLFLMIKNNETNIWPKSCPCVALQSDVKVLKNLLGYLWTWHNSIIRSKIKPVTCFDKNYFINIPKKIPFQKKIIFIWPL